MSARADIDFGSLDSATRREVALWSGAAMVVLAAHLTVAIGMQAASPVDPIEATQAALTVDLSPMPVTSPESIEAEGVAAEVPSEALQPVDDSAEPLTETAEAVQIKPVEEKVEAEPVEEAAVSAREAKTPPDAVTPVQPEAIDPARLEPETARSTAAVETDAAIAEPDPIEPTPVPADPASPVAEEPAPSTAEADIIEAAPPEIVEQVLPEIVSALPEARPLSRGAAPVRAEPPQRTERTKPAEKPAPVKKAEKPAPAKRGEAGPAERAEPRPWKKAAARQSASKSAQKSVASKAPSISPARWQSKVLAWINKYKRYPRGAKSRGDQGVAQVNFAVDREGTVVSVSLASSSGNAELDKAAVDMVRRASPVPAPPEGLGARIRLALPVQFGLR